MALIKYLLRTKLSLCEKGSRQAKLFREVLRNEGINDNAFMKETFNIPIPIQANGSAEYLAQQESFDDDISQLIIEEMSRQNQNNFISDLALPSTNPPRQAVMFMSNKIKNAVNFIIQ